ncbi:MAG: hypothetical protein ACRC0W_01795 [Cetobacterium sp.]
MNSEKLREDLLKKYGETMRVSEIAREFNYSLRTIRKALGRGEVQGERDSKNLRNYLIKTESLAEKTNI